MPSVLSPGAARRSRPLNVAALTVPRTVREMMTTDLVTVVPEMTVRELIEVLLAERITGAPVLSPTGKVMGVVSATDVLRLAAKPLDGGAPSELQDLRSIGRDPLGDRPIRDIMTPVAFTVHPDESPSDVGRFFRQGGVRRALVMEGGMLLGIVTPYDVMQALLSGAE